MASITSITTPGVYVQELNNLPPSVASVPTAIPAFIGYTQTASNNGQDLTMVPTLISSLLDYATYYGTEYDLAAGDVTIQVNTANNFAVSSITLSKVFYMYEALRHFFDNGGGQCYIVSVGNYTDTIIAGDETATPATGLRGGVAAVAQFQDPTLLLFPDAVRLDSGDFYSLQQMALLQSATLQDRFSVLDLQETTTSAQSGAVTSFRNAIGINNLEYGAAYTPWVYSSYSKTVTYDMLNGHVENTSSTVIPLTNLSSDPNMIALVNNMAMADTDNATITKAVTTIVTNAGSYGTLSATYAALKGTAIATPTEASMVPLWAFVNALALEPITWGGSAAGSFNNAGNLFNDLVVSASNQSTGLYKWIPQLIQLEENKALTTLGLTPGTFTGYDALKWLQPPATRTVASFVASPAPEFTGTTAQIINTALNTLDPIMTALINFVTNLQNAASAYSSIAQTQLFNTHPVISNIVAQLSQELSRTPPSGAMVGVYANVDSTMGVWKAPANVSLNSITGPSVIIDDTTQGGLNVDPIAGKSINAIRSFTGRGTIVWGARTLDGNDDNWRYISVRRLFIMVEQAIKDACATFVFEPNDATTWAKVQAMISNYMINLWREQAIVGSKPELSYYVSVGLGKTMSAEDINQGFMIVEVGMAPVRPAEFIVITFSQLQQQ
jgi:phage tail sheath protein FI